MKRRILHKIVLSIVLLMLAVGMQATERQKINFNGDWRLAVGDYAEASKPEFDDRQWQPVTLPYAFNGNEAFRKDIVDLTDTICWYRKTFVLTENGELRTESFVNQTSADPAYRSNHTSQFSPLSSKLFIEFEGARQGADVWVNGQKVGFSDNGVMAFGFDITPYVKEGENVIAVRCDNNWKYRDRVLDSRYQWNDNNFNANYGGLPKNVWLHITGKLYQTLPLYSNLGTTGTYIYATDIDVAGHKAVIHAESEVKNEDITARTFTFAVRMMDADGREVACFNGETVTMQPGETRTVTAQQTVEGLHFWSWGYGYLYMVETGLVVDGETADRVATRTGFRKTRFAEGKIWLNDRVMMVHGYAQRTSNEWPGVGISVPAWLSDYSNGMMVESGANMVRWMHVTPWKQDVESCDRVGLPQAMPAGDAEKDVEGARWQQRTALMRDAIIYNRNNPSILFYECGNESISREHMLEMKAIRNQYDPHGGRAIGSREMLDIDEAEYGGEMLYINKSKKHPMWAMEYCRDEGLRKYWDEQSYPFHKEGDGPLYRGKPANEYNHNMDEFAVEMVRRWYDYWRERPGTGTHVSSGGVKIVFSDTNTHHRGEKHYRTSGVVDAMRIPKDAFFAHQVMWNGWVEPEEAKTYIVGHWNYPAHTVKSVYVVSTGEEVELFLNGRSLGKGKQSYRYLFSFDNVGFEPGMLEAVGSDGSRYQLETVGEPYQLKLTTIENPQGIKADGADMVLVQVEVTDKQGRRCPLDGRKVHFSLWGEARWIGGIETDAMSIPVECGVNRVLLRTTTNAGSINLSAYADGVKPAYVSLNSKKTDFVKSEKLSSQLDRGETPITPSYKELARGIDIVSAKAGYDSEHAVRSYDDNELSEWKNDGRLSTAWITYKLAKKTVVDDICLKLTGWRLRSYPIEVYAGKQLIWSGETERSLGYIHLTPTKRVKTNEITIRLKGAGKDKDAFGGITELAQPVAGELDLFKARNGGETKSELRIVEIEFIEHIK
ncbi:sugar-binding domain-containing protein [uncultured Prevotella sp.]|uniref:glycoside hydrolase family 2 protein n=1 Tax=uncultured Prevotella sp. TaxID=159272 RepID=UPI0025847E8A|nr:sugar-binding domain-containing protein [uncultured Prevotella sp.]